jgi:hypothetical protein
MLYVEAYARSTSHFAWLQDKKGGSSYGLQSLKKGTEESRLRCRARVKVEIKFWGVRETYEGQKTVCI